MFPLNPPTPFYLIRVISFIYTLYFFYIPSLFIRLSRFELSLEIGNRFAFDLTALYICVFVDAHKQNQPINAHTRAPRNECWMLLCVCCWCCRRRWLDINNKQNKNKKTVLTVMVCVCVSKHQMQRIKMKIKTKNNHVDLGTYDICLHIV